MQRCLASLKGKRQKIGQLQQELQHCQSQVNELETQLDEAKLRSSVRNHLTLLWFSLLLCDHFSFLRTNNGNCAHNRTPYVCLQVRDIDQLKHLDMTTGSKKELMTIQEDKLHLQQQVEVR